MHFYLSTISRSFYSIFLLFVCSISYAWSAPNQWAPNASDTVNALSAAESAAARLTLRRDRVTYLTNRD